MSRMPITAAPHLAAAAPVTQGLAGEPEGIQKVALPGPVRTHQKRQRVQIHPAVGDTLVVPDTTRVKKGCAIVIGSVFGASNRHPVENRVTEFGSRGTVSRNKPIPCLRM